jgi:hypothetical protein
MSDMSDTMVVRVVLDITIDPAEYRAEYGTDTTDDPDTDIVERLGEHAGAALLTQPYGHAIAEVQWSAGVRHAMNTQR